jgi:hypothetical protein
MRAPLRDTVIAREGEDTGHVRLAFATEPLATRVTRLTLIVAGGQRRQRAVEDEASDGE